MAADESKKHPNSKRVTRKKGQPKGAREGEMWCPRWRQGLGQVGTEDRKTTGRSKFGGRKGPALVRSERQTCRGGAG